MDGEVGGSKDIFGVGNCSIGRSESGWVDG